MITIAAVLVKMNMSQLPAHRTISKDIDIHAKIGVVQQIHGFLLETTGIAVHQRRIHHYIPNVRLNACVIVSFVRNA